jgi:hypothetical protein
MARPKRETKIRLEVIYELASPEKRDEILEFFAALCGQGRSDESDSLISPNSLPVGYKQGPRVRRPSKRGRAII